MRTGRPANSDTIYKMGIHVNGTHRYASTQPFTIGEDGKKRYAHKHWGTVDENLKFHPNTSYLYLSIEERAKFIFPKEWDLSELENLASTRRRGRVSYEGDDVDRQYGATWLLDRVAEKTGLLSDLKKVFNGNMEIVNDILTLAYYPFVDNLSYNQLAMWQREVKSPSEQELTSPKITRLTQSITEKNRMDLFRYRAARVGKEELCAVDSTSMSTYGFNLVDIRWGKNKEHLPLKQTLEVVVYSLTSHMPIYYKELPGNTPDCRTIDLILTELEHAGFRNLILITDRGYESMKNLESYIAKKQRIITSVKVSGAEVLKIIKGIDMRQGIPHGMMYDHNEKLFYVQHDAEYSVKGNGDNVIKADKYKINIYYNPIKRASAICDIQHAVNEQQEIAQRMLEAKEVVINPDDIKKEFNLLNVSLSKENTIASFEVNQEKVDTMLLTAGFFASKTIGLDLDPLEARDNYGMRDEQEKCFALQKGPLGQDRLRVWSESSKHGRMFICFVGLILASYVRHTWESNDFLHRTFDSTEAVLAEMRTIRCIEHTGRMKFVTPFVGNQVKICEAFGFDIPDFCAPVYVSKAKPVKHGPGRPRKPKVEKQTS